MRPHEKLEVWKKAVDFVVNVYKETGTFPSEEKFGLTSQIRRSAISIPANIAEGAARHSDKEFAHFVAVAQGSCSELETELLIGSRLGFLAPTVYSTLRGEADAIGRMLVGLSKHLRQKGNKS
ncbi:MAG: four helix bundle protein [Pyrinomonadaceae bacterium]|nr:four helix bundle protein [Pyrinomonadaceae bacterium]